jgi:penicillin-binding protein 2
MALVVNNGIIYQPHVVQAIQDTQKTTPTLVKPTLLHKSPISQETWLNIKEYLRTTVLRGTGWMLNRTVAVAGKTGTAEIGIDGSYHDWFSSYAPYEGNPEDQVVVVVQIEAGDHYEWVSTKIADVIYQGIFANQDYYTALENIRPWYMNWYKIVQDYRNGTAPNQTPATIEEITSA